jgi:hypothetical protein
MPAVLNTTKQVNDVLKTLKAQGCTVLRGSGTITVKDTKNQDCYRALQKGKGGPWIVRLINTEQVQWKDPMDEFRRKAMAEAVQ